jgi:hypothetical protein
MKNTYKILFEIPQVEIPLGRLQYKKMEVRETGCHGVDWI